MNRREWVRFMGAGAAGLALGPLGACGDNLDPRTDGGVVVLEPWAEGFLVAVWAAEGDRATVVIRADDEVIDMLELRLVDGLGSIDVGGLVPDTMYEVTTLSSVGPLGPNLVRTAPRDDDPRPVRIAVSGDYDPSPEFESELIDHVIDAEPELFVSLGDFPYTDNGPVAKTVAEYRARHVALRIAPTGRQLIEAVGIRAIYDDHEFHNDWNPVFVEGEPDRYAAAMQVWDEMFPIRAPVGDIRYRSWRWGANVECFLIDCRRFRSANAALDGPGKEMLGAAQRAWLVTALRASTASFKLVFTSVPLDFGHGNDSWVAFTHGRGLLLDALVGISGLLFLTADQHYFAAHVHAHGVREFMTGPLRRGIGEVGPIAPGVRFRYQGYNAALLDIHADRIELAGVGANGERFYTETLTVADLTPG
ncbi:MAG: alkaline phosphatase D family protein [Polyangiales bacterium]